MKPSAVLLAATMAALASVSCSEVAQASARLPSQIAQVSASSVYALTCTAGYAFYTFTPPSASKMAAVGSNLSCKKVVIAAFPTILLMHSRHQYSLPVGVPRRQ